MQPGRTTNTGGGTMEMKAAAPRCQLLLILLMSAVMLLPGTNGSLLLVQRTVTRTIALQETISKGGEIGSTGRAYIIANVFLDPNPWEHAIHIQDGILLVHRQEGYFSKASGSPTKRLNLHSKKPNNPIRLKIRPLLLCQSSVEQRTALLLVCEWFRGSPSILKLNWAESGSSWTNATRTDCPGPAVTQDICPQSQTLHSGVLA
ncbi:hypothetical protein STEG23_023746 [Scotinomys teguina]